MMIVIFKEEATVVNLIHIFGVNFLICEQNLVTAMDKNVSQFRNSLASKRM